MALLITGSTTFAKPPTAAAPLAPASDCFHIYYKLEMYAEIGSWEDPSMYEDVARVAFTDRLVELQAQIKAGHPGCTVHWVPDTSSPDGMVINIHSVPSSNDPNLVVVLYSSKLTFKVCCPEGGHEPPM